MKIMAIIGILLNILFFFLMDIPELSMEEMNSSPIGNSLAINTSLLFVNILCGLALSIYCLYRATRRIYK